MRFLSASRDRPITVGDEFELNDNRAVVVGIVRTKMSEQGTPYVFTTYERAERFAPAQRTRLTHILAAPEDGVSVDDRPPPPPHHNHTHRHTLCTHMC